MCFCRFERFFYAAKNGSWSKERFWIYAKSNVSVRGRSRFLVVQVVRHRRSGLASQRRHKEIILTSLKLALMQRMQPW